MKPVINNEDKAVSPIIATILLIAITVVLAATLVTILGGFTHGVSNTVETAGVTSKVVNLSSTDTIYINVSSSSSPIPSSDITIQLSNANFGSISGQTSESLNVADTSGPTTFQGGSDYVITGIHPSSSASVSFELIYKGNVIYNSAA